MPLLPVLSNIKSLIDLHLFGLWIVNHLYMTRQARRNWFLIIFETNRWYQIQGQRWKIEIEVRKSLVTPVVGDWVSKRLAEGSRAMVAEF